MMGAWMIYAAAVGALLSLAALAAESLLRSRGQPGRWAWVAATAASIGIPLVGLGRARAVTAVAPPQALPTSAAGEGLAAGSELASILRDLLGSARWQLPLEAVEPWLLPAWLVASAALGLTLACGLLRLASKARGWPVTRIDGTDVLLSDDVGPAVVGVRRPSVVVPRWMLGLDAARLRLAVLHEEAHRTAGDAQLLLASAAAVVLAPWNPALWWQLRRLRTAVELDCDGRVLARGAPRHAYGSLLLDAGAGELRPPLPVAALFGNKSDLERRLIMIGRGMPRRGRFATAALGAAAVLGVALACEAVPPMEPTSDGVRVETATAERRTTETSGEPIIYVDGVRLEERAAFTDLNPDAIERIEIIKGGAAERLFGSEAAPGVIQIFLKEGVPRTRTLPK